jgi:cytochrome P450
MSAECPAGKANHKETVDRLVRRFDHHDPELSVEVLNDVYDGLLAGPQVQRTEAHGGFSYVTRYEDICEVSRNPQTFCSGKGVRFPRQTGTPLAIPPEIDRPLHTEYRKLFMDVLSAPKVRAAEPFLRELTNKLLRDYVAGPQDNFSQHVAVQLPIRAVGTLVGWDLNASDEMQGHALAILEHYGKAEAVDAVRKLSAIAQAEIDARRVNPRDDYLTVLINAKVEGRQLTDDELQNILRTFIFAGFETTAHMIGSLMAYLAQQPELQERIRTDDAALANFVEEALRMFPPVQTMFRTVVTPTELHGVQLPPGEAVGLLYAAANRDPKKFEHPEKLDVDRANAFEHVSFGFGIHRCAGSQLARAEIRILLEELRQYPPFTLGGPVVFRPHLMGGQMMGPERLPISFRSTGERA